jgi:hypothetical protein
MVVMNIFWPHSRLWWRWLTEGYLAADRIYLGVVWLPVVSILPVCQWPTAEEHTAAAAVFSSRLQHVLGLCVIQHH